ncbi:MAG: HigA family addiction module antidote protein [Alphaproteobacteria bacterium]|nr:HigA family addiction module antidote protein [Alphaproteobacteria bacterium]
MAKTHFSHPGGILKRQFLSEYNLSVSAAAKAMNIPRTRLNDIVLCRRGITPETALRLGKLFGNGAAFWLNLQSHYDLAEAEAKAGKALNHIHSVTSGEWSADNGIAHA